MLLCPTLLLVNLSLGHGVGRLGQEGEDLASGIKGMKTAFGLIAGLL